MPGLHHRSMKRKEQLMVAERQRIHRVLPKKCRRERECPYYQRSLMMNLKLCITIGTAAIGWMSSGGDIQAVEQQDLGSSGPFEIAQSPGTGGPVSSGAPGGGEGSGMPSGQTERGLPSTTK